MSGWICLHRGWSDCEAFEDDDSPMSEREAWVWLLENAAWKDTRRRNAKGEPIEVKRGQYHTSLRTLGKAFRWGKNKVSRYLEKLVSHGMVGTVAGQSGLMITICNYEKYQSENKTEGTVSGTAAGQLRDTQEQRKQDSLSYERGVPPSDPVKQIFDLGLSMLSEVGMEPRQARSLIGRWRKDGTDGRVMAGLLEAKSRRISNVVEWMPRYLKTEAAQPKAQLDLLAEQAARYRRATPTTTA